MQANQPSLGKVTLVYIGYYLAIAVFMNVALWALERFAGFVIEANSLGWLPLIIGAMFAGQFYGTKVGAKPPQSYSWMAGLLFMLTSIVLSVGVLYVIAVAMGLDIGATIRELQAGAGEDTGLVLGIIGGVMLLIWVIQRFMFSTGAAGAIKQAERLAAKGK
ncbi:MAG: ABZJ_00895 family protein [Paracoccaceae bacterium]